MIKFATGNKPKYMHEHPRGSLRVVRCVNLPGMKDFELRRKRLDQYLFVFVTQGSITFNLAGKDVVVRENEMMVIKPYISFYGSSQGELSMWFVYFETDTPALLEKLYNPFSTDGKPSYRALAELLHTHSLFAYRRQIQCELLLSLLHLTSFNQEDRTPEERIADAAHEYIVENIAAPLTAETVSQAMHYHKDYLGRVMKKVTGASLKKYINDRRLEKARVLLSTSSYPVSEVARAVGFDDSNLFTKFFSYHMGKTPMDFRKGE